MSGMVVIGKKGEGDAHYRYKMPSLQHEIEGRGNGIRTSVRNLRDVAAALDRDPEIVVKAFGIEMGAQSRYDATRGYATIMGAHDTPALNAALSNYIKKFVLCHNCGLPETNVVVKKGDLFFDCRACGTVSQGDIAHRLTDVMIKKAQSERGKKKLTAKERRALKAEKQRALARGETVEEEPVDKKGKKGKKGSNAPKAEAANIIRTDETGAELPTDMSDLARMAEEAGANLGDAEEDEEADPSSFMMMGAPQEEKVVEEEEISYVEELRKVVDDGVTAIENKLISFENLDLSFDKKMQAHALFDALITGEVESKKLLDKYSELLKAHGKDKSCQKAYLMSLEALVTVTEPQLNPRIAVLLKACYDLDICEEEAIIEWSESRRSKKAFGKEKAAKNRTYAAPFINWLNEAESESESEEYESESEEEAAAEDGGESGEESSDVDFDDL